MPEGLSLFRFSGNTLRLWFAPQGDFLSWTESHQRPTKGGAFPRLVESTPLVLGGSASNLPRPRKSPAVPEYATTPDHHGQLTLRLGTFPVWACPGGVRCCHRREPVHPATAALLAMFSVGEGLAPPEYLWAMPRKQWAGRARPLRQRYMKLGADFRRLGTAAAPGKGPDKEITMP